SRRSITTSIYSSQSSVALDCGVNRRFGFDETKAATNAALQSACVSRPAPFLSDPRGRRLGRDSNSDQPADGRWPTDRPVYPYNLHNRHKPDRLGPPLTLSVISGDQN